MKRTLAFLILVAVGFVAGYGYGRWYALPGSKAAAKSVRYHCPMHPHVKSDQPGDCPICGMKLVPDDTPPSEQPTQILYYQDPKQLTYRSDQPGVNPETGNTLVPVFEPASTGLVMIPTDKQAWIGLKTGVVEIRAGVETVRANGRVVVDETRVTRVQTRLEGWIEKVHVDFTGRLVKKGEPMLTLYSPELLASQQEYLLARKARETMEHSPVPGVNHFNASMLEVSRTRLEHHWGMSGADIEELERTGKPRRAFTLNAPAGGFVMTRNAYAGQMAKPDMELYTLADLTRVWIVADIYESDAGQIRLGQSAMVEPAYAPGRRFQARITNILPQVDAETRTLKVRLEADNKDFFLRPDLYVNVDFPIASAAHLSVPEDAVIDTGNSQTVYLDRGEGRFEPRRVQVGERATGRVEILSGLQAGDRIVVSGAFLVDSESRMRSGAK